MSQSQYSPPPILGDQLYGLMLEIYGSSSSPKSIRSQIWRLWLPRTRHTRRPLPSRLLRGGDTCMEQDNMWEAMQSEQLVKPRPVLIFRGVYLGQLHPALQPNRHSIKFSMHFLAGLAPGRIQVEQPWIGGGIDCVLEDGGLKLNHFASGGSPGGLLPLGNGEEDGEEDKGGYSVYDHRVIYYEVIMSDNAVKRMAHFLRPRSFRPRSPYFPSCPNGHPGTQKQAFPSIRTYRALAAWGGRRRRRAESGLWGKCCLGRGQTGTSGGT